MGCSSKWGAFMLPVVATTVQRFFYLPEHPSAQCHYMPLHVITLQHAITTSDLVCVGEMSLDLVTELLDARLQLGKKGCICVCQLSTEPWEWEP